MYIDVASGNSLYKINRKLNIIDVDNTQASISARNNIIGDKIIIKIDFKFIFFIVFIIAHYELE